MLGINRMKSGFIQCNRQYFHVPTVENSYWAGFIAADGCLEKNEKVLVINLSANDKEHLEKFVRTVEDKGRIYEGVNKDGYAHVKFQRTCHEWCRDLRNNWGIRERKSLVVPIPHLIDEQMIMSYVLGYLDGDGYVRVHNDELKISVAGGKTILTWIRKLFIKLVEENECNYKRSKNQQRGKKHATLRQPVNNPYFYTYEIGGYRAMIIWDVLMRLDSPVLKRKWFKKEILEWLERKRNI